MLPGINEVIVKQCSPLFVNQLAMAVCLKGRVGPFPSSVSICEVLELVGQLFNIRLEWHNWYLDIAKLPFESMPHGSIIHPSVYSGDT